LLLDTELCGFRFDLNRNLPRRSSPFCPLYRRNPILLQIRRESGGSFGAFRSAYASAQALPVRTLLA